MSTLVFAKTGWSLPVLGFGTFAVGTTEFVLAGVLPQVSSSLGVSMGAAGQVVTAFALSCAVFSPVLGTVTAAWPRRAVLLLALLVYLVGNVSAAVAPSFAMVLIGQIVAGAVAGLYIPSASVTASALVPAERRGRAIAAVTTGLTAAAALGAPVGTMVGGLLGWRATMWFVSAIAVVALTAIAVAVPEVTTPPLSGLRQRLAPLRDRRIVAVMATTLLAFTSVYTVYTYISVVFAPATGTRLAVLIFVFGLVGTAGNFGAGTLADRVGATRVVAGALALVVVSLLAIPFVTGSYALSLVVIVVFGVASWSITTPQQHRLMTLAADSAPLVISLNAAVLFLAISLAGVVGGIGAGSPHSLPIIAAVLAAAALGLTQHLRRA
jgi:MFS transporter, DHA1 family, inner membrane transport protein